MTELTVYIDLMCPWAYQATRWLREVRRHRDITLTWRCFSLEEANRRDDQKHPWERQWSYSWSLLRIMVYLRQTDGGEEAVDRFCEVAGRMLHEEGVAVHTLDGARQAVQRLGWDAQVVDEAVADDRTSELVRAEHDAARALGVHGVPTLVIDGRDLLYGPVVAPAPVGDAALRLWDLVVAWTEFPHLYEIVRVRGEDDDSHVAATFEPYRVARGWHKEGQPWR